MKTILLIGLLAMALTTTAKPDSTEKLADEAFRAGAVVATRIEWTHGDEITNTMQAADVASRVFKKWKPGGASFDALVDAEFPQPTNAIFITATNSVSWITNQANLTNETETYWATGGYLDQLRFDSVLVTNITESNFAPGDPTRQWGGLVIYNTYNGEPPPKNEKFVTTTISRQRTVSFIWDEVTNVVTHVTGISTNTVHMRVKQDWETVPN